uniref:Uncharacterized protein n=1 Tax=Eptatretus burgeri TaxID=7764 RepID=A0A8C4PYX2_EPTBU
MRPSYPHRREYFMMMGTPDEELEKFLNEQKIRLLQDRATLDQNPSYIDIMVKQHSSNPEEVDKPCQEFVPPFNREKGVSTGELIQPISLVVGQEYEERRQHLKEELLQDFCRYMAERAEIGISCGSRDKLSQMRAKTSWATGGRRFHKDSLCSGSYNDRLHQASPSLAIEPSTCTKHDAATTTETSEKHSLLKSNQTLLPKDCDKDSAKRMEQAMDRQMKCVQVTAPYADTGTYDRSEINRAERQKKEKYGRELLAQMAECKINKKREKEFQLAVPISGAVDPQKNADRLAKMLGSPWKADFSKSPQAVLQPHPPPYPPPKTTLNCRPTHIQHVLSHGQNQLPSRILLHNHNPLPPIGHTYIPSTNCMFAHSQVHHNYQNASNMPEPSAAQFETGTNCGCAVPCVGYTDLQPLPMYAQPHMQTVGLQYSRDCFLPPGNQLQCVATKQAVKHTGTLSAHDHTVKQSSELAYKAQTEEPTSVIMTQWWKEGDDGSCTDKLTCHEELKIQMKNKEMQRKREQNGLSTIEDYNPWGRGGGGAPNHDVHGNILTDLRKMHQQNKVNRDSPSLLNPLGSPTSASPQSEDCTKNAQLYEQKRLPASQMEVYKLFLQKQIQEDRQRRAEEKRTMRELDEQEECRVAKEREKMAQEYEKELALQRLKDMEVEPCTETKLNWLIF